MPDLYAIVRAGQRANCGDYAVIHLGLGESLDCAGIILTLEREQQADGSEARLVLVVEQGDVRGVIDARTPLSFLTHCGVLLTPRAIGKVEGLRVELVMEARSVCADAVMPQKVAA